MRLSGVELRWVSMPLVAPFHTVFGVEHRRDALLVRAVTGDVEGWGECVAMTEPTYSAEYLHGAAEVIRRYLVPILAEMPSITAATAESEFARIKGHQMAKAAVQSAILDAQLRCGGMSLAEFLGAVSPTVPVGVSVGFAGSIDELLETVAAYRDAGYRRVKLKIEPGWDIEPVRAVRELLGPEFPLQVDANCAYTLADARHLARLDAFDLVMIEQPFDADDLAGHAALASRCAAPICLDESVTSARMAAFAISIGAAEIVNLKPGRVGGLLEARRVHDVCAAHNVPVWIGGMLETGLGRAANLALAALPACVLPGDISASDRYYAADVTAPFVLDRGHLPVPTGAGIGVAPVPEFLQAATVATEWLPCHVGHDRLGDDWRQEGPVARSAGGRTRWRDGGAPVPVPR